MTSAVDASPNERRIGLLWGIFIFGLDYDVVPCSYRTIQSVAGYPPERYLPACLPRLLRVQKISHSTTTSAGLRAPSDA
jgi:hypothetical protein